MPLRQAMQGYPADLARRSATSLLRRLDATTVVMADIVPGSAPQQFQLRDSCRYVFQAVVTRHCAKLACLA